MVTLPPAGVASKPFLSMFPKIRISNRRSVQTMPFQTLRRSICRPAATGLLRILCPHVVQYLSGGEHVDLQGQIACFGQHKIALGIDLFDQLFAQVGQQGGDFVNSRVFLRQVIGVARNTTGRIEHVVKEHALQHGHPVGLTHIVDRHQDKSFAIHLQRCGSDAQIQGSAT